MKFKIGEYIEERNEKEYFAQCVSMEYLFKNIRIGDKFLTYRDNKYIKEFEFAGFSHCNWAGSTSGSSSHSCKTCKGYLNKKGLTRLLCPGYTKSNASCVLEIITSHYLDDELFEI